MGVDLKKLETMLDEALVKMTKEDWETIGQELRNNNISNKTKTMLEKTVKNIKNKYENT